MACVNHSLHKTWTGPLIYMNIAYVRCEVLVFKNTFMTYAQHMPCFCICCDSNIMELGKPCTCAVWVCLSHKPRASHNVIYTRGWPIYKSQVQNPCLT